MNKDNIVLEDDDGVRLDKWFHRHYPNVTQGNIQKMCRKGQIRVDGHRVQGKTRVEKGAYIKFPDFIKNMKKASIKKDIRPEAAQKIKDYILYEDEALIVLNKPSGLATQGGTGIAEHIDMLLPALVPEGAIKPKLVHRIDRETSGILLIGKTPGVTAKLAEAFRNRDIEKKYWAIVLGRPSIFEGVIDQPLVKIGKGGESMMAPAGRKEEDAISAKTSYFIEDAASDKFSWIVLSPLTGRKHQLRVHCESLGTPILGDPRYGGKKVHIEGFHDQLHLHARQLDIPHPLGGRLIISAPLPQHMQETFQKLGFIIPKTEKPKRIK